MKAMVCMKYGPPEVLQLKEVKKPIPKNNEILIKVHATPVSFGDTLVRHFNVISPRKFHMPFLFWLVGKIYFGFRKPKIPILGSEFSGEVESVGKDVNRFSKGDPVFGYRGPRMGAYAEYLCMPENGVVAPKPANMSYEEAASVPYGAIMALNVLRKANLQPGQKILVNGASGGIGPAVVQLARSHFGAIVTGVCSTPRLEYVRSLGAEKVIDYTREDFINSGETYDCIVDILGKSSFARCQRSLKPNGRCFFVSFKMRQVFQMLWTSMSGGRKAVCVVSNEKAEDLTFLKDLIEAGEIKTIIDRCFPLEQAADAHRYVEQGHKKGNIVITLGHADKTLSQDSQPCAKGGVD
ncbi:MAG: NAD(P)-dependent alcohol dehydrogenase [Candidatus Aminicenantales bacterium]